MNQATIEKTELPAAPSLLGGVGVAAVVVTAIVGWVAIGSTFLSEMSLFGGFLILWYWAKVEHLAMARLPATVLGALVGIALAWAMYFCASRYGGIGFGIGLGLLILAIYLDIVQVFPTFVNAATMLLSIIAAAPLVQLKVNWIELSLATVGGGLFFGAYVATVMSIAAKFTR
jgi:hypothetical protein